MTVSHNYDASYLLNSILLVFCNLLQIRFSMKFSALCFQTGDTISTRLGFSANDNAVLFINPLGMRPRAFKINTVMYFPKLETGIV